MGTWAVPNTLEIAQKLVELLKTPLAAKDASDKLYDIVGDDDLFDDIDDEAKRRPDVDVRPIVGLHIESMLETVNVNGLWKVKWQPEAIELLKKEIVINWGETSNATRKYKRGRDLNRRSTRSKKSTKAKKKGQVNSRKSKASKKKTKK